MVKHKNKLFLCALGSEILTDDGLAIKLARDFMLSPVHKFFFFKSAPVISFDILDEMMAFKSAIIIDIIKDKNFPLGYVFRDENLVCQSLHLFNPHEGEFQEIYQLVSMANDYKKIKFNFIFINVSEVLQFGEVLSPEIRENYWQIYYQVEKEILNICREYQGMFSNELKI